MQSDSQCVYAVPVWEEEILLSRNSTALDRLAAAIFVDPEKPVNPA
jgi:hypothetical protein